jgi:peroxiredoxin
MQPRIFELPSIEGDTIRLSSYRGKVVLISFWAIWCRPCVLELPHLRKIAERYTGSQLVTLLSINMDQPTDSVAEFVIRNDFKMKVLYDHGTSLKCGVEAIPAIMIIDRRGNVAYKHVGFSGDGDAFVRTITGEIEGLLSP